MRKILFFLLTFILIGTSVNAQPFRLGFTGSPQMSWFKSDNGQIANEGLRLGFNYGLLIDYMLDAHTENFGRYNFSTGIRISHNQASLITTGAAADSFNTKKVDYNLQYLQIPLTIKLRTSAIDASTQEEKFIVYYGQFGLVPSFNLKRRADVSFTPESLVSSSNQRQEDVILANLALEFQAGLEYTLTSNTSFIIALFFNNGFVNILDDDDKDRVSLNSIGINTGFTF